MKFYNYFIIFLGKIICLAHFIGIYPLKKKKIPHAVIIQRATPLRTILRVIRFMSVCNDESLHTKNDSERSTVRHLLNSILTTYSFVTTKQITIVRGFNEFEPKTTLMKINYNIYIYPQKP